MIRGFYTAASGMMLQRRHMDVITNNLANAETTGFRRQQLVSHSFDDVLARRIGDIDDANVIGIRRFMNAPPVGPMTLGTQVDQLFLNFEEGRLEGTELSTDLAIVGDAFFVVQTEDGERFTRAGAFRLDDLGYIVDAGGHFLLGEGGPIMVGYLDFTVNREGVVRVGDEIIDTIRTVSFEDNNSLRQQGYNLFLSLEPPLPAANQNQIIQGFLESSNVDIGREMVDMLTIFRVYEANQRMLTMIDETVGMAVNEIGRVR
ncbi:MAG: flagellar hook-basal body protein [Oscillospiraceae bacterium]|nr:flagellar hook-basal body protein [Oscillospiraceae bacterium]